MMPRPDGTTVAVTPPRLPDSMPATPLTSHKTAAAAKSFAKSRDALTAELFAELNAYVFGGQLPAHLVISWHKRLLTTAGRTVMRRRGAERSAEVELSTKVVDCYARLRNTLAHELCHAAAWLVDGEARPPHGACFSRWARAAEAVFHDLDIRTCHSYAIAFRFNWRCVACGHSYGRHSNSIKPLVHRCARCQGVLVAVSPARASGGRLPRHSSPHSTPRPRRQANAFAVFVQANFARVKASQPSLAHVELMAVLAAEYKASKRTCLGAEPSAGGAPGAPASAADAPAAAGAAGL